MLKLLMAQHEWSPGQLISRAGECPHGTMEMFTYRTCWWQQDDHLIYAEALGPCRGSRTGLRSSCQFGGSPTEYGVLAAWCRGMIMISSTILLTDFIFQSVCNNFFQFEPAIDHPNFPFQISLNPSKTFRHKNPHFCRWRLLNWVVLNWSLHPWNDFLLSLVSRRSSASAQIVDRNAKGEDLTDSQGVEAGCVNGMVVYWNNQIIKQQEQQDDFIEGFSSRKYSKASPIFLSQNGRFFFFI